MNPVPLVITQDQSPRIYYKYAKVNLDIDVDFQLIECVAAMFTAENTIW